jgi:type I site-specific restriction endonuclease
MNEADTRANLIDPQLKSAGWDSSYKDVLVQREYNIIKIES